MSAIIYLVTNLVTGAEYVGFTTNLASRMWRHARAEEDGKFHRAIRKYGWENFDVDVIFEHDDEQWTLDVMEPHFIAWYDTFNNGYNLTEGGEGCLGYKHTEETKRKLSEMRKGKPGWSPSEETRRKQSEAKKGIPKSKAAREAMSRAKKGKPLPKATQEARLKAVRGRTQPPEERNRRSEALKRYWANKRKAEAENPLPPK